METPRTSLRSFQRNHLRRTSFFVYLYLSVSSTLFIIFYFAFRKNTHGATCGGGGRGGGELGREMGDKTDEVDRYRDTVVPSLSLSSLSLEIPYG